MRPIAMVSDSARRHQASVMHPLSHRADAAVRNRGCSSSAPPRARARCGTSAGLGAAANLDEPRIPIRRSADPVPVDPQHPPIAPPFESSAAVYDDVYGAKGKDYSREVEYVRTLINRVCPTPAHRRLTLLDVACGTGEHLRHLQGHFSVAGVDANAPMLDVARGKLPRVAFTEADMTTFTLARRFDVITCLFGSIAYLPGPAMMAMALQRMAVHLGPEGVLLVEPGVTPERLRAPERSALRCQAGPWEVHRVTSAEHVGDALRVRFDYALTHEHGRFESFREEHVIRLFTTEQYEVAFCQAGLHPAFDHVGPTGRGLWHARRADRRVRGPGPRRSDAGVPPSQH